MRTLQQINRHTVAQTFANRNLKGKIKNNNKSTWFLESLRKFQIIPSSIYSETTGLRHCMEQKTVTKMTHAFVSNCINCLSCSNWSNPTKPKPMNAQSTHLHKQLLHTS